MHTQTAQVDHRNRRAADHQRGADNLKAVEAVAQHQDAHQHRQHRRQQRVGHDQIDVVLLQQSVPEGVGDNGGGEGAVENAEPAAPARLAQRVELMRLHHKARQADDGHRQKGDPAGHGKRLNRRRFLDDQIAHRPAGGAAEQDRQHPPGGNGRAAGEHRHAAQRDGDADQLDRPQPLFQHHHRQQHGDRRAELHHNRAGAGVGIAHADEQQREVHKAEGKGERYQPRQLLPRDAAKGDQHDRHHHEAHPGEKQRRQLQQPPLYRHVVERPDGYHHQHQKKMPQCHNTVLRCYFFATP